MWLNISLVGEHLAVLPNTKKRKNKTEEGEHIVSFTHARAAELTVTRIMAVNHIHWRRGAGNKDYVARNHIACKIVKIPYKDQHHH